MNFKSGDICELVELCPMSGITSQCVADNYANQFNAGDLFRVVRVHSGYDSFPTELLTVELLNTPVHKEANLFSNRFRRIDDPCEIAVLKLGGYE